MSSKVSSGQLKDFLLLVIWQLNQEKKNIYIYILSFRLISVWN